MMPMNLQEEEVKKFEEQESAINVACPMGLRGGNHASSMVRL